MKLNMASFSPVIKPYLCFRFFFSPKRNGSPKNLLFLTNIFTFENTKKSNLKTGPPINISKSFFGKPPGFNVGFDIFQEFRGTGVNEKMWNDFGGLTGWRQCCPTTPITENIEL